MVDFIYKHKYGVIGSLLGVLLILATALLILVIKLPGESKPGPSETTTPIWQISESEDAGETSTEEMTEPTVPGVSVEPTAPVYPSTSADVNFQTDKARVWVGESRVAYWLGNQYRRSVSYDPTVDYFIAKGGCNYVNFARGTNVRGEYDGTGLAELEAWVKTGKVEYVFFITGINDAADLVAGFKIWNGKNFIDWWADTINYFALAYPTVTFVYGNIGPVSGNYQGNGHTISPEELNPAIVKFNEALRPLLHENVIYVDLYSEYMKNGFQAADGVHYDYSTNEWTYQYLKSIVGLGGF